MSALYFKWHADFNQQSFYFLQVKGMLYAYVLTLNIEQFCSPARAPDLGHTVKAVQRKTSTEQCHASHVRDL